MAEYVIERVEDTLLFTRPGQPVRGKLLQVYLPEFDEAHELRVPDIKEATVKKAAERLLEQRRTLVALGQ